MVLLAQIVSLVAILPMLLYGGASCSAAELRLEHLAALEPLVAAKVSPGSRGTAMLKLRTLTALVDPASAASLAGKAADRFEVD